MFIYFLNWYTIVLGFPGGSVVKNLPAKTGDVDAILGLGRSPGEENPMDREAWQATDHGIMKELDIT